MPPFSHVHHSFRIQRRGVTNNTAVHILGALIVVLNECLWAVFEKNYLTTQNSQNADDDDGNGYNVLEGLSMFSNAIVVSQCMCYDFIRSVGGCRYLLERKNCTSFGSLIANRHGTSLLSIAFSRSCFATVIAKQIRFFPIHYCSNTVPYSPNIKQETFFVHKCCFQLAIRRSPGTPD
jgi:hypothetical protein